MLISDVSWGDYGISRKEKIELRNLAESGEYDELIQIAASMACPELAKWLFVSVAYRKTYEDIEYIDGHIPTCRTYFYGYRRKVYYLFKKLLEPQKTDWKVAEDEDGQLTIYEN